VIRFRGLWLMVQLGAIAAGIWAGVRLFDLATR
jgi:hypothetical protein